MSESKPNVPADQEAIEAMAARWLVDQDEGFTPLQAAAFARWCAADPKHAAAVAMLEETSGILARLPLVRAEIAPERKAKSPSAMPGPSAKVLRFPAAMKVALAAAACVTFAVAVWWLQASRVSFSQTYVTATAKIQRVVLPDESIVELNGATEVRVQFSKLERRLTLAQGEAHFTVAKNPARPFLVSAGKVAVRAVGTAFNVRRDRSQVEVIVTEGRVQISQAEHKGGAPLLSAGQRLTLSAEGGTLALPAPTAETPVAIKDALAWRAPRLVFMDTPLSEVVRQFNQHNRVQLEVADIELGRRPVGGEFRADHVEAFVRLLEDSGDITVARPDAGHIVLRRASAAK